MPNYFTHDRTKPIKIILLGAGELGKEVVIEAQRLGCHVIAVDRYNYAPAMHVANKSYVIDMLDPLALRKLVLDEKPDLIIPEIEAIATDELVKLEEEGFNVIPTANATRLTMDREGIRKLAAEELNIPTSPFHFVDDYENFKKAAEDLGYPCIVKPVMSSSGKGQMLIESEEKLQQAWDVSQSAGRSGAGRVILEGFVKFDYEITLLTVRHVDGTAFCEPIGHRQEDGDYQESWQPQQMTDLSLAKARDIATKVTEELGGFGLFGVELFVRGDNVIFSEISPRPHDTGMVTLISQDLSQFALHIRAVLGLPIPKINQIAPSASYVITANGHGKNPTFSGIPEVLRLPNTNVRIFGKPEVSGKRRVGVCLARDNSINAARRKAESMQELIQVELH
ncbi:MAG: formate-dependent phosphoribosylglycinamide formyltransferase [Marinicellaceae bacterium]